MKTTSNRLVIAALAALLAIVSGAPASAQQCASPAEARQAVGSGQAVPLSVALSRAGISGQVVKVALCRGNGGYVYRISVLDRQGRLRQAVIPAS